MQPNQASQAEQQQQQLQQCPYKHTSGAGSVYSTDKNPIFEPSSFEDLKSAHFNEQRLQNAMVHDNLFLDICLQGKSGTKVDTANIQQYKQSGGKMASICLNSELKDCFNGLWMNSDYRICVSNSLQKVLDCSEKMSTEKMDTSIGANKQINQSSCIPTHLISDDGTNQELLNKCKQMNCQIVDDKNQSSTDLEKCLYLLKSKIQCRDVIIYGFTDQRIDKQLAALHALFEYCESFNRLMLISDGCLIEVLRAGVHVIIPNKNLEPVGRTHCGLFPLQGPVGKVVSSGLEYNLEGDRSLQMGNFISSANLIVSERVLIECSEPLIWTTDFGSAAHMHYSPYEKSRRLQQQQQQEELGTMSHPAKEM